jgi:Ca2+-binding EF-hand superfamily protein
MISFFFKDLRQAFSSVDSDNDGLVYTKDIPIIFAHLDQSYKSFIVEGDDLKRLINKIDIDG